MVSMVALVDVFLLVSTIFWSIYRWNKLVIDEIIELGGSDISFESFYDGQIYTLVKRVQNGINGGVSWCVSGWLGNFFDGGAYVITLGLIKEYI